MQYFRHYTLKQFSSQVYFLPEDICDIVHGIFDTKIKQHMISTGSIDSITKMN